MSAEEICSWLLDEVVPAWLEAARIDDVNRTEVDRQRRRAQGTEGGNLSLPRIDAMRREVAPVADAARALVDPAGEVRERVFHAAHDAVERAGIIRAGEAIWEGTRPDRALAASVSRAMSVVSDLAVIITVKANDDEAAREELAPIVDHCRATAPSSLGL